MTCIRDGVWSGEFYSGLQQSFRGCFDLQRLVHLEMKDVWQRRDTDRMLHGESRQEVYFRDLRDNRRFRSGGVSEGFKITIAPYEFCLSIEVAPSQIGGPFRHGPEARLDLQSRYPEAHRYLKTSRGSSLNLQSLSSKRQ